jgi:hypothetical protein
MMCTGFMWLRTGTTGKFFWRWKWNSGFHKRREIYRLYEKLFTSERWLLSWNRSTRQLWGVRIFNKEVVANFKL